MKNSVIKYGLYGLFTAMICFLFVLWFGQELSYSSQEVLGYLTMIASLSFVYFGIRHYRDQVNNGRVSFWKAVGIGVLISAFVGLGIGIVDYIYTTSINPDFASEYLERSIETMEATLSGDELELKKAELTRQMEDYGGSGFMAILMFVTVLIIGFVIALISGLILQRKI
ncbi:DUF4199 domain-containing protein [Geojedonia litorea]|uniref:DUF4199 domain-containing protein n=1 Tax=Geojedonia litorea TaxID=1268269 RepID=A0ABV9N7U2_9FLAO